VTKPRLP
jgi:erlin